MPRRSSRRKNSQGPFHQSNEAKRRVPVPENNDKPDKDASHAKKTNFSPSYDLRTQGNDSFKKFKTATIPTNKKTYLRDACDFYQKAIAVAGKDDDDLWPAYKNLSVCHGTLTELESCYSLKMDNLRDSAKYRADTLYHGERAGKDSDWVSTMLTVLEENCDRFISLYNKLIEDAIEEILSLVDRDIQTTDYHIMIAKYRLDQGERIVNKGTSLIVERDFVKGLPLLGNCYRPIEEAKKHVSKRIPRRMLTRKDTKPNDELLRDIEILEKEYISIYAVAEGLQAYNIGVAHLEKAKSASNDDIAFQSAILAMDNLKNAEVLARGEEVELIAMVYVQLGLCQLDVFKAKARAKTCFLEAVNLSSTLCGTLYNREWYIEATTKLQDIRKEDEKIEEEKLEKQRRPYLDQLKPELAMLWAQKYSRPEELVEFLWKEFPPKHVKEAKKPLLSGDITEKKIMLKLCQLYHPDKVNKDQHDAKYVVLCEEITKLITNKYERMK